MKLELKFVNKGKPFEVGNWTVEQHEEALALMVKQTKKLPEKKKDEQFKYYVIYVGLKAVDPEVELAKIRALHPENVIELWNIIYYTGKVDIFFQSKKSKKVLK